jgi:cytochrome P450
MLKLGPRRLIPPFAVVTSPQGARDVLGVADGAYDKENLVHVESRDWGNNVFNLPYEPWLERRRALQPLFTKNHVASFAGHMAEAADAVTHSWITDQTVDLNQQCRALTLRVVGWSIFGVPTVRYRSDGYATPLGAARTFTSRRYSPRGNAGSHSAGSDSAIRPVSRPSQKIAADPCQGSELGAPIAGCRGLR